MFTPASSNTLRILPLDALRGFALFGVLMANIFLFNSYTGDLPAYLALFPDSLNQAAGVVVKYLFKGRFYPIFSFLFGLGLGMQFLKSKSVPLLLRRLLLLLIIGVLHYVLVWDGDILVRYALLGFVSLIFLKCGKQVILASALLLYLLHCFYTVTYATPGELNGLGINPLDESIVHENYSLFTLARSYGLPASYSTVSSLFYSIKILVFVLFGVYLSKLRVFERYSGNYRLWLSLFAVLLVARLSIALAAYFTPAVIDVWLAFISFLLSPALYVCALMALVQLRWLSSLTRMLAAAGRMSLTNYVMQNIILAFVFYGYGLAQYQQWQSWQLVVCASALFILQGYFSNWWLRRFKQGPLEKLWRELATTKAVKAHEVYKA